MEALQNEINSNESIDSEEDLAEAPPKNRGAKIKHTQLHTMLKLEHFFTARAGIN